MVCNMNEMKFISLWIRIKWDEIKKMVGIYWEFDGLYKSAWETGEILLCSVEKLVIFSHTCAPPQML